MGTLAQVRKERSADFKAKGIEPHRKQYFRGDEHRRPYRAFGMGISVIQMYHANAGLNAEGNQFLFLVSTAKEVVYPEKPQKFFE